MGHARKERVLLVGTDQRITSGPAAKRPHSKAEYMTAPERFADSQIPLAPRAPSIHDPSVWTALMAAFPEDSFLVGLSSIHWREAWKYGERAFRYCQHDVGHALAAISFSANLLGWKVTWLNAVSDAEIAKLLGFDQTQWPEFEAEHPELLCFVHPSGVQRIPRDLPSEIISEFSELRFQGTPNQLSEDHVDWEIISRVVEVT